MYLRTDIKPDIKYLNCSFFSFATYSSACAYHSSFKRMMLREYSKKNGKLVSGLMSHDKKQKNTIGDGGSTAL